VLGVGGTGIVYELLHKSNGQRYAMKEMEIKNKTQMRMAVSEAEMLKDIMENVSHPNIMHIERVFQVGSKFYMVFPLCTGGELYEHIIRRGHFTEHDAAVITRDLISGLHALHKHDILHLDIKPENILFDSMDDDARIKITDFGLSKVFSLEQQTEVNSNFSMDVMKAKLQVFLDTGETYKECLRGTIGYMSPELILTGHCSKATDVFAAGVVLYILLSGRPPFNSKANREVLEKTARGIYRITGGEWDHISDEAKDLVRRMLDSNPLQRITTAEILQHPWLQQLGQEDELGDLEAIPGFNVSVGHLLSDPLAAASLSAAAAAGAGASAGAGGMSGGSTTVGSSGSSNDIGGVSSFGSKERMRSLSPMRGAGGGVGGAEVFQKKLSNRKKLSDTNLSGALRQLSGHVKQRRSEKLATNLSRIVSSFLQQDGTASRTKSTLASQYLIPVDAAASGGSKNSKGSGGSSSVCKVKAYSGEPVESELLILNSDFRAALVAALTNLDEIDDGRLTIEQFAAILTQLIGINSISITTVLMGR
jgi:serine/threonine protein kinase